MGSTFEMTPTKVVAQRRSHVILSFFRFQTLAPNDPCMDSAAQQTIASVGSFLHPRLVIINFDCHRSYKRNRLNNNLDCKFTSLEWRSLVSQWGKALDSAGEQPAYDPRMISASLNAGRSRLSSADTRIHSHVISSLADSLFECSVCQIWWVQIPSILSRVGLPAFSSYLLQKNSLAFPCSVMTICNALDYVLC